MRLEHLCDVDMKYVGETVDMNPYGRAEGEWFGQLEGVLRGPKLNGQLHWANHARQREDGVWCPDAHGYVTTKDGAKIFMTMRGYNVRRAEPPALGSIVATCTFGTSDERYRWLNEVIAVAEGTRDAQANETRLRVFACINEMTPGIPRIG